MGAIGWIVDAMVGAVPNSRPHGPSSAGKSVLVLPDLAGSF
jgi:hypothetical protein